MPYKILHCPIENHVKITEQLIPTVALARKLQLFKSFSKYGAVQFEQDSQLWDSLSEWKRWRILLNREDCGQISGLKRQVEFDLNRRKYVADFAYIYSGEKIVEEVKSPRLALTSKWKEILKLMETLHGIKIKLVSPRRLLQW